MSISITRRPGRQDWMPSSTSATASTVSDFAAVRRSGILGVIHKATEGGDWTDASYAVRQPQAERAGLLWGAYHFGTRQYSGAQQAQLFLSVVRPAPSTLIALDLEPNDGNPRNTMTLAQAEAFVHDRAAGDRPPAAALYPSAVGRRPGLRPSPAEPRPAHPAGLAAGTVRPVAR